MVRQETILRGGGLRRGARPHARQRARLPRAESRLPRWAFLPLPGAPRGAYGEGRGEEGRVVGEAEVGEVRVQLAGLEAAGPVTCQEPEGAAHLVAAIGGEGGPAFGAREKDGEAAAGGDVPQADGVVIRPGGEGLAVGAESVLVTPSLCPSKTRTNVPVATSHRRTVRSSDRRRECCHRGWARLLVTTLSCPSKVWMEGAGSLLTSHGAHGMVRGTGGEGVTIGAEGHAHHPSSYVPRRCQGRCLWRPSKPRTVWS